jgi:hypothetical protein
MNKEGYLSDAAISQHDEFVEHHLGNGWWVWMKGNTVLTGGGGLL